MYTDKGRIIWYRIASGDQKHKPGGASSGEWYTLLNVGDANTQPWGYEKITLPTEQWMALVDAYAKIYEWLPYEIENIAVAGATSTFAIMVATSAIGYREEDNLSVTSAASSFTVVHIQQVIGYREEDNLSVTGAASNFVVDYVASPTGYGDDESVKVTGASSDLQVWHSTVMYSDDDQYSVVGATSTFTIRT
jgi:hypothetical protein